MLENQTFVKIPYLKKCSKILVCISEMYSGKRFFGMSQFSKLATSSWDTKNTFSISFCKLGNLHHQISWSSGCDTYFWIRRPGFNSRPGIFLVFFKILSFTLIYVFFNFFKLFSLNLICTKMFLHKNIGNRKKADVYL